MFNMKENNASYHPIILSMVLVFGLLIGYFIMPSEQNITSIEIGQKSKINNILHLIQKEYVDIVNQAQLEGNAVKSILKELDPHSTYITKEDIKTVNEDMEGSFGGIGVEFIIQQDTIVVVSPISGGPSERLGIRSGDRILVVEQESVAGIGIENKGVINRLRGEIGTKVSVQIKRNKVKTLLKYIITRGEIPLFSLDAKLILDEDIGYIKLNRFSGTTSNEFYDAAKELLNSGMESLILDLRQNPGGYLDAAINVSDQFLGNKEMIVFTEGRNRKRKEFYAKKGGLLENIEVVVLVDEGSASASEIVAGAIQDNDRGNVIGRRTFGKGLVQEQIPLYDGSVIRLTTQRYYTPTGRNIQRPYNKGSEDYYMEVYKRFENGELNNKDSISFADSLIFKTPKGNLVYGGGGIMPDYFIAIDTSLNNKSLTQIFNKGWFYDFCFYYADKHRETLNKEIIKKLNVLAPFEIFVKNKDADFNFNLNKKETDYLDTQLKANIGRNLWGNSVFYSFLLTEDKFVKKAKELFNNPVGQ